MGDVPLLRLHRRVARDTLSAVIRKRLRYQSPRMQAASRKIKDPVRATRLLELARGYLDAGAPEAAADVLGRAVVIDPDNIELRIRLAEALYRRGAFDSALAWLDPLCDRGPARVNVLRGRILSDLRRASEAVGAFRLAIEQGVCDHQTRLYLAAALIASGLLDEAGNEIDAVLDSRPGNSDGLMLSATAMIEAGRHDEALRTLALIDEENRSAEHFLLTARTELLAGKPATRIERTFLAGMQRFPADGRLRLAFARMLASRRGRDPQAASRAISLLEEIGSGQALPEALFLLAQILADTPEDRERAAVCYQRGLSLRPDDPAGLAGMGELLLLQGRPGHAVHWLINSLLSDPERSGTIESLAKALCAIADDEAVARWLGLITSALPTRAPAVLTHLLRFVQEAGRTDAYEDVRREGHRMKNLVAVLANRLQTEADPRLREQFDVLYRDWTDFLGRIRLPVPAPALLAPGELLKRAIDEAAEIPGSVRLFLPANLPQVKGDRDGLAGALANVIRNAVQSAPHDKLVRVAARSRPGSGWLEIAISDEGPGIDLMDQGRIFEAGFSTREGGSGLGLSITQRVIMLHGGRISVASAPGGPTTFTIRLPVADVPLPQETAAWPSLSFERRIRKQSGTGA